MLIKPKRISTLPIGIKCHSKKRLHLYYQSIITAKIFQPSFSNKVAKHVISKNKSGLFTNFHIQIVLERINRPMETFKLKFFLICETWKIFTNNALDITTQMLVWKSKENFT